MNKWQCRVYIGILPKKIWKSNFPVTEFRKILTPPLNTVCQSNEPRYVTAKGNQTPKDVAKKNVKAKGCQWAKGCHKPRDVKAKGCHKPRDVMSQGMSKPRGAISQGMSWAKGCHEPRDVIAKRCQYTTPHYTQLCTLQSLHLTKLTCTTLHYTTLPLQLH